MHAEHNDNDNDNDSDSDSDNNPQGGHSAEADDQTEPETETSRPVPSQSMRVRTLEQQGKDLLHSIAQQLQHDATTQGCGQLAAFCGQVLELPDCEQRHRQLLVLAEVAEYAEALAQGVAKSIAQHLVEDGYEGPAPSL